MMSLSGTLKLEDFLPAYSGINIVKNDPIFSFYKDKVPKGYNREFPISTFLKKEFNDLRLPLTEPEFVKGSQFKPLNQQAFMARFMSPLTPYDKMLVFHEVGTGKACLGAVVSELALSQYFQEEKDIYKRETIILNKNKTLRDNTMNEIANKCTNGKYLPDRIDSKTGEPISYETYVRRMNSLLGKNYIFETFEVFASKIAEMTKQEIKQIYSNRLIIIDEVHNISAQYRKTPKKLKDGKPPVDIYNEFYRFLHSIENCKVLLMTATPIRDKKKEISALFNLILPEDKNFNTDTFDTDFFEGSIFRDNMKNIFKERIRGLVSYVRVTAGNVRKIPQGEVVTTYMKTKQGMKKVPLVVADMEPIQSKAYEKAFLKDGIKLDNIDDIVEEEYEAEEEEKEKTPKRTLYTNSRQASMFVTPDGGFGEDLDDWLILSEQRTESKEQISKIRSIKGKKKYNEKEEKKGKKERDNIKHVDYFLTKTNDKLNRFIRGRTSDHTEMIDNLSKISIKFSGCIHQIITNQTEKAFVYSNLVTESGTELFCAILELFGYEHIKLPQKGENLDIEDFKPSKGKKQYLLITGTFPTTSQTKSLIKNVFNNQKNIYGDYLQVIVASKIVAEGVSFFHCRQFHNLTPGWNETETSQAQGRVVRVDSHVDLPIDERYIKLFRWCAFPDNSKFPSIDFEMYKLSEDKDFINKQIERLMKESAVDCALNIKRNMRPGLDYDNSRECDYDSCIYYCDNIPSSWYLEEKDDENKKDKLPGLIYDSYNLYYATEQIEEIKQKVSKLFQTKFIYHYQILIQELPEASELVILRALKELVDKSIPVINKYGLQSYVRESLDLYYLVDSYDFNNGPLLYLLSWYNINPILKENISFENWVNIYEYEFLQEKMNTLNDTVKVKDWFLESSQGTTYLAKTFQSFSLPIQESLLESFYQAEKNKININTELRKEFLTIYKKYIIQSDDKIVSTLLKEYDGTIRCFIDDKWHDCKIDEEKIEKKKDVAVELGDRLVHYGYYGISDPVKVLKIASNTTGVQDERIAKKQPGQVCGSGAKYSASKIKALMLYLGDKAEERGDNPPIHFDKLSTKDLKSIDKDANPKNIMKRIKNLDLKSDENKDDKYNFINILDVTEKDIENFSIEKMKRWYGILTFGKSKILCPSLRDWFKDLDMLL